MTPRKEIQAELHGISQHVANAAAANPYRVPAGYFDTLADLILLRIRSEHAATAIEELEVISPLLAGLPKKTPYGVPEGYFDRVRVPEVLPEPVQKPAKVVALPVSKVFRIAAAAVTVGLISVITWVFIAAPKSSGPVVAATTRPAADTAAELQVRETIGTISESEMTAFLEGSDVIYPPDNTVPFTDFQEADVQLMLADVPDRELEQYLKLNTPEEEKFN